MKKVVYLSGPMSGIEDYNYPKFTQYAETLRAKGLAVINPAENVGGEQDLKHEWYMKHDLLALFSADALLAMHGWEASRGAQVEAAVALSVGLPAFALDPMFCEQHAWCRPMVLESHRGLRIWTRPAIPLHIAMGMRI